MIKLLTLISLISFLSCFFLLVVSTFLFKNVTKAGFFEAKKHFLRSYYFCYFNIIPLNILLNSNYSNGANLYIILLTFIFFFLLGVSINLMERSIYYSNMLLIIFYMYILMLFTNSFISVFVLFEIASLGVFTSVYFEFYNKKNLNILIYIVWINFIGAALLSYFLAINVFYTGNTFHNVYQKVFFLPSNHLLFLKFFLALKLSVVSLALWNINIYSTSRPDFFIFYTGLSLLNILYVNNFYYTNLYIQTNSYINYILIIVFFSSQIKLSSNVKEKLFFNSVVTFVQFFFFFY